MKRKFNPYIVHQKGMNQNFPMIAEIWSPIEEKIPDWLIDFAKVSIKEDGEMILATRERSTGEIEILASGGRDILVTLKDRTSWILFSKTHPLMSVTNHQLDLLYDLHLRN